MIQYHKIILFSSLLICLSGCGFNFDYIGSRPVKAERGFWTILHEEKIHFPDFSINLWPQNDIKTFEMGYFIIIPFYFKTEDTPVYNDARFKIRFAIQPHKNDLTFNPSQITLQVGDKQIPVVGIDGPLNTYPVRGEDDIRVIEAWTKRGRIMCYSENPGSFRNHSPQIRINLSNLDKWHCYEIIFETEILPPDQDFSITIRGVSRNGAPYEIPTVLFEKFKWGRADSAP